MHNHEQSECDLRFAVLGPVKVWRGREDLRMGARQQKALLVALLLRDGHAVTAEKLIDDLWGEQPPKRAKAALRTYASGIRKALGPDAGLLVSESGGYALRRHAAEALFDIDTVSALTEEAEKAGRSGDHDRARKLYCDALEQWNGEALAHIPGPFAEAQRSRLQEWRLGLLEHRLGLDLRVGDHVQAVAELTTLTAAHPLRERLRELLMLALYRSGRQAEALEVYQDTRGLLAESLGIDPGRGMQRLHQQILTSDAALTREGGDNPPSSESSSTLSAMTSPPTRRPPVPRQLPAPPALFTGRGPELAQLSAALLPRNEDRTAESGRAMITAVGGTGGVGKTCLALRWAHDHRDCFPDGELYVDLRGFDPSGPPLPPAVALCGFLDAFGVDPAAVPNDMDAQIGLYRSLAEGKRMLIVLDNARDTAQVRPLLPGSGACSVLVTSRSHLAGLVTEHAAGLLQLGVLDEQDARELLALRLGQDRVETEPRAAGAILQHCGGLPLGLSILAARAAAQPHLPLGALAEELAESAGRLDALDAGEVTADLRAVFSTSYQALDAETARAFALLGLTAGPDIGVPAAASLIAETEPGTRRMLRALEAAHLIRQHAPGRYQLHDLVHLFAADCAYQRLSDTTRAAAQRRLVDFYLHTARHAAEQLAAPSHVLKLKLASPSTGCTPHHCSDATAAREWFEAEDPCLRAIHKVVRDRNWHTLTWQLSAVLLDHYRIRGRLEDLDMWRAATVAAEQLSDPAAQAAAQYVMGTVYTYSGRYHQALVHLKQALSRFEAIGDLAGQADTHYTLGSCLSLGKAYQEGLTHIERALRLYRESGDHRKEAICLNSMGMALAWLGDCDLARRRCEEALAMSRATGDQGFEAAILDSLGFIAHRAGHYTKALDYYLQSLPLIRKARLTWGEAVVLRNLSETHLALGQYAASRQALQQAVGCSQAQHPIADTAYLQEHLDALDKQVLIGSLAFPAA